MDRDNNRLLSLELRGYKSIPYNAPLYLEFDDINILLGANGAGKSNVISFFRFLGHMMDGDLQRYVAFSGTNSVFLNYGSRVTSAFSARLKFRCDDYIGIYSLKVSHAIPDRLIVESERIELLSADDTDRNIVRELESDHMESALVTSADSYCRCLRKMLESCKAYQFNDSSATSPMRQASAVDSAHYLQSQAENLASFLYFLKMYHADAYDRIIKYVRGVVPQFKDFYLEPAGGYVSLKWRDDSVNDYILSADQLSDGSIRFIALATVLLQPAELMPFMIIIDEPELGLHPYAVDQLNEMIKDASRHAQILISTQSTALIDGFGVEDITVVERDENIDGTVARRLDGEEYREWLKEYTISELWNKNVIGGRPV